VSFTAADGIAARKRAAAEAAAGLVEPGMRLGLGTGSTVAPFLEAIAHIPDLRGTATSERTAASAADLGIVLEPLSGRYDLYVDGADQVAPRGDVIKGGGGAHVREKLVALLSDRLVIICDDTKLVPALHGPVPVAVVPFAAGLYEGARPLPDDNGLVICDVPEGDIADPASWDEMMRKRPGVLSTGIFPAGWLERILVAGDDGVSEIRPN
jgi:ribose 5-phosphate isomerase A